MTEKAEEFDAIIIGGGFYGACLALYLRSIADRIVVLEAEPKLLARASYVNQARVHTGFHYPRSFVTAQRSLALYQRFTSDFRDAVVDDFTMLYAIARRGSKISPQRFERMFEEMQAPIARAKDAEQVLFDSRNVSAVFRCEEYAFDASKLRDLLSERMETAGIDVRTNTQVTKVVPDETGSVVALASGARMNAPIVINATYGSQSLAGMDPDFSGRLKYELTEVALVEPPSELKNVGITLMDGPFFSMMPFPARNCHSLTHVRFTPHAAWLSGQPAPDIDAEKLRPNWLHMMRDAERFVPAVRRSTWLDSLFEIKTIPLRNESDDGRPILFSRHSGAEGCLSILGGKLDNIYDLFQAMKEFGPTFAPNNTPPTTKYLCGGHP